MAIGPKASDNVVNPPLVCTHGVPVCTHPAPIKVEYNLAGKPPPIVNARSELLREAERLVNGDRNNQYGPPTQDFDRTARILNALGYSKGNQYQPLEGYDVAIILMVVKFSRLVWGSEKFDTWTDLAGYAACGWECVDSHRGGTPRLASEGYD